MCYCGGEHMARRKLKLYGELHHDIVLEKKMPDFLEGLELVIMGDEDDLSQKLFSNNSKAYFQTTENLDGYYDRMNLEGSNVLTVIASGEHVFNAVLRGAKKIDAFDISIYAIMFYYLKEAALKTDGIDYDTYIKLFYIDNDPDEIELLSVKKWYDETYKLIKPNLNPIAVPFWDRVFKCVASNMLIASLIRGERYHFISHLEDKLAKYSACVNRSRFDELKEKMKTCEINVFLRDIKELDDLEGPYKYMIFSNIYQYCPTLEFKNAMRRYMSKMTPDGTIIVGYAYAYYNLKNYREFEIQNVPSRERVTGSATEPNDKIIIIGKKLSVKRKK